MQDLNDKVTNGGVSAAGKLASGEWNQVASELQNAITASGLALDGGVLTQLLVAITKFASGQSTWCTDSGSSSAYVLTPLYTVSNVLFSGLTLKFRPANNSTVVAPTVNYNGTGAKTIKNEAGDGLVVGDLSTLRDAEIRYDGTDFRLLTRSTNLLLASMYRKGYIHGFYMTNGTSNANYGVSVTPGDAANSDATLNLITASLIEKRIDTTWAAGTNVGGRPAAVSHTNDTWYRVFVIGGASASTEIGFDTSITATNLLSAATTATGNTYNKYRQIGWVQTDGSGLIRKFYMNLNDYREVLWQVPVSNANGNNPGSSRVLLTVTAPPDSNSIMSIWAADDGTPEFNLDVRPAAMDDNAASDSNFVISMDNLGSGEASNAVVITVLTNSSSQIAYRFQGTLASSLQYIFTTRGFLYNRGVQ
jgi:hypothetical protein